LRGAAKALGIAAAASVALPAAQAFAAPAASTMSGLDLLRAWASGQLPANWLPGAGWQSYTYGPLTFMVPSGWGLDEVNQNGETGVWVNAPDSSCGFAALQLVTNQTVNSRDAALWQIGQMTGVNEFDAIYDDYAEAQGINGSFIAMQLNETLVAVHCLALAGKGNTTLNFWVQFGVTDVFDAATEQIFLPFMCQFAVASKGGSTGGSTGGTGGGGGSSTGSGYPSGSGEPGDVINPNDCVYERDPGEAGDVINPDQCTVYEDSNGDTGVVTNSGEVIYTDDSGYDSGYDDSSYDSGYDDDSDG
jgi:hypothetical protein